MSVTNIFDIRIQRSSLTNILFINDQLVTHYNDDEHPLVRNITEFLEDEFGIPTVEESTVDEKEYEDEDDYNLF